MNSPDKNLTDAAKLKLTRNALRVAGEELGPHDGDHWPMINQTIDDMMLDYENLQIERRVHAEIKKHLYAQLDEMERALPSCSDEARRDLAPKILELREIYEAYFDDVFLDASILDDMDMPLYVRRAEAIIGTLSSDHDDLVLEDMGVSLKPHNRNNELELTD